MLVHGGMAQNVGPILEMVTEKYLLRSEAEWDGAAGGAGDPRRDPRAPSTRGDIRAIGAATTRNFFGPLQTIIPWASNLYTETLIDAGARARSATTSGASGCSAACPAAAWASSSRPQRKAEAQDVLQRDHDGARKRELEHALPFAMEPVVYDFAINPHGTFADAARRRRRRCCRRRYYALHGAAAGCGTTRARSTPLAPGRARPLRQPPAARGRSCAGMVADAVRPAAARAPARRPTARARPARTLLRRRTASTAMQHEQIRADLQRGRIGLAQNRLPVSTDIHDVDAGRRDRRASAALTASVVELGRGGAAPRARWPSSRWPPASAAAGRRARAWSRRCTRSPSSAAGTARFLEVHLAKSRRVGQRAAARRCRTSSPPAT